MRLEGRHLEVLKTAAAAKVAQRRPPLFCKGLSPGMPCAVTIPNSETSFHHTCEARKH